uniref:NADH dehydrogenase subunit 2 n=1 Tax=Agrilus zanthoxylumi TaxID=2696312 RepID=UPI00286C79E5|nr:NADH dehydrogenase subunit 2 [Agrilus zanthoxylumi]WKF51805.1 NADH dehydrogenase subunit 2 [Agrilus zanthoxylumi]
MTNLFKMLFSIMVVTGTMISISSKSWFGVWIGLEMNLLSIIPLMNNSKNFKSTESSLKYFITQAMASMILLMSILVSMMKLDFPNNLIQSELSSLWMVTSLLIKMGAAPFHFWFPEVMEGLSWLNALIMLTWQKITPMVIIIYSENMEKIIVMSIIMSVVVGGLMGMNQTSLRKIISYSSINHIGWMMAALLFSETLWNWYFIIYSTMNMVMTWMFSKFHLSSISQFINTMSMYPKFKTFFVFNFFSLGGLPPFIGFLPKWMTIQMLVMNNMYVIAVMMIMTTLITLYFYMQVTMPTMSFMAQSMTIKITNNQNLNNKFMMTLNTILLMSLLTATITFNWT